MSTQRDTVLKFIERINAHDVNGIVALMAEDYRFVNSSGDSFHGLEFMREEWTKHFDRYPDFHIHVNAIIAGEEGVGVFGEAEGTYTSDDPVEEDDHWRIPAAFYGIASDGKMAHWQVYADSSVVFEIIKEHTHEG